MESVKAKNTSNQSKSDFTQRNSVIFQKESSVFSENSNQKVRQREGIKTKNVTKK